MTPDEAQGPDRNWRGTQPGDPINRSPANGRGIAEDYDVEEFRPRSHATIYVSIMLLVLIALMLVVGTAVALNQILPAGFLVKD